MKTMKLYAAPQTEVSILETSAMVLAPMSAGGGTGMQGTGDPITNPDFVIK